jgi:branched-chain amino acid transport system substrate-binding protein
LRKKLLAIAFAAFAIAVMVWILKGRHRHPGSAVRVGVILPLTGDAAVYGKAIENGIELARDETKQTRFPSLDLVYEDDQGQATQAVSAVRRLIDIEKVPVIIGGAMSSTAEAIIPICNNAEVVLISPTATKPSLTHMGKYFLRLWPSDDYDGKVMADVASHKLGLRRVSILYVNVAYGVGITQVFTKHFESLGGEIVGADGYSQGETDFRAYLLKVQEAKPQAVYLPGYVTEVNQILKQAKELNLKVRFLGVNSLYDPKLIEIAGSAAEGAVFTYPAFDTKSSAPAVANFVSRYGKEYGADPDAFAAQGYDAFGVLVKAINLVGKETSTGPQILAALHSLGRYDGVAGSFTFDSQGDVEKELRLLTIRDGRFVSYLQ